MAGAVVAGLHTLFLVDEEVEAEAGLKATVLAKLLALGVGGGVAYVVIAVVAVNITRAKVAEIRVAEAVAGAKAARNFCSLLM